MKAMSIWLSPVAIDLTRPPCERIIASPLSLPCDMASPMPPLTPEDSMSVMVPSSIIGTRALCAFPSEDAQILMFLRPMSWISFITMLTMRSPSRKWWWNDIVMPSWASHFSSASRMLATSFDFSLFITGRIVGPAMVTGLSSR